MSEEWRPVVGYEGVYEVSAAGPIRRRGPGFRQGVGRGKVGAVLRPNTTRLGYARVGLMREGRCRPMFVHRIVAAAFIGPCPDGLEINHKNGIKLDNRAENLEYTTRSANMKHAYDSGLRRREFLGTQWRGGRAHGQTAASPQKGSTNV